MLFAVLGFAGPIMWLYSPNLVLESFCLMNMLEPICGFGTASKLDCMEIVTNSKYLSLNTYSLAEESKFSGYIESGFRFQMILFQIFAR